MSTHLVYYLGTPKQCPIKKIYIISFWNQFLVEMSFFIIVWVALRKFSMMVNWIWLLSGPGYANVMGLIVLYTERNSKQSTFNLSNILFLCWWNVLLKRLICFNDVYNQLIFNQTVEKIHFHPSLLKFLNWTPRKRLMNQFFIIPFSSKFCLICPYLKCFSPLYISLDEIQVSLVVIKSR